MFYKILQKNEDTEVKASCSALKRYDTTVYSLCGIKVKIDTLRALARGHTSAKFCVTYYVGIIMLPSGEQKETLLYNH